MISQFNGEYKWLSNMKVCNVTYDGVTYPSVENAYQAQKNPEMCDQFVNISPYEARRLGKRAKLRADWDEIKLDLMYTLVKTKFTQNPSLANKLLLTGDEELEEGNTWGDTYLGVKFL